MLIVTHTAIGVSIGAALGNPYLAAPLSLSSHYLVDGLPHFELSSFRKPGERNLKPKNWFEIFFVFGDIVLTLIFLFVFRKIWSASFFSGFAFSIAPDFLDNIFLWSGYIHRLPIFKELHKLHDNFHFTARGKKIWLGILTQICIISICLIALKSLI